MSEVQDSQLHRDAALSGPSVKLHIGALAWEAAREWWTEEIGIGHRSYTEHKEGKCYDVLMPAALAHNLLDFYRCGAKQEEDRNLRRAYRMAAQRVWFALHEHRAVAPLL